MSYPADRVLYPQPWHVNQRIECPCCGEEARMYYRTMMWVWIECSSGCVMSGKAIDMRAESFVPTGPPAPYNAMWGITYVLRDLGLLEGWQSSPESKRIQGLIEEAIASITEESDEGEF